MELPQRIIEKTVAKTSEAKEKSLITTADYIITTADYMISTADYMISTAD
ncbi:MAG: hypothetical protein IJ511_02985 [Bacteroides sp.]|nr:hypothetical protein [Bacteroides sp.]